jgi:hypothetical protein
MYIYILGRHVVFYSTLLLSDGIYTMIEVGAVNCPLSLKSVMYLKKTHKP